MFHGKPAHKSRTNNRTGTIKKNQVEKTESFFKFFQNPVMYEDEDEEEDDEEVSRGVVLTSAGVLSVCATVRAGCC